MTNEGEIRIVYVDDAPETELSRYLSDYKNDSCIIKHEDITFSSDDNYDTLLGKQAIQTANILLIDSALFKNRSMGNGRFTGEEFKLILRKKFPFMEVFVVTQNDIDEGYVKIPKYNSRNNEESARDYYEKILPPILDGGVKSILDYRKIVEDMRNNNSIETVLVEKISNSLDGISNYEALTKEDIDEMVSVFREVQEAIDGKGL